MAVIIKMAIRHLALEEAAKALEAEGGRNGAVSNRVWGHTGLHRLAENVRKRMYLHR